MIALRPSLNYVHSMVGSEHNTVNYVLNTHPLLQQSSLVYSTKIIVDHKNTRKIVIIAKKG